MRVCPLLCTLSTQGDEAQQRAMMKSYQESNGTVLSTNWAEVGAKKVRGEGTLGVEPAPEGRVLGKGLAGA